MSVQIITDSTSYLHKDTLEKLGIKMVSLNVTFDSDSIKEVELDNDTFYKLMDEKGIPISSQPSVNEIYENMKTIAESGDDVLCVFLSSEMSGTFSTAHIAKNMILDEFKDTKIEIIDSKSNCMQLGFCAVVAAKAAKEGKNIMEIKEVVLENIRKSRFIFVPDNLVYLRKGGRIGGASALVGGILKIIPILTVENGVTTVFSKVRTKSKAVRTMLDKVIKDMKQYEIEEIVVHHINCIDEARELACSIKNLIGIDPEILDIGPVIGLHVGPGAIGIAYYTKENMR